MNWQSWSDFWAMGGYGFYVWGSYLVTVVLILGEILQLRARKRGAIADAKRVRAQQGSLR
jgi:heme exporter protein D